MGCTGSKDKKKEPKPHTAKPPTAGPAASEPAAAAAAQPSSPPPARVEVGKEPPRKQQHAPVGQLPPKAVQQSAPKEESKNVSVVLGIPTSCHHLIIGKGGSTIKEFQTANDVRITVERGSNAVVMEGLRQNVTDAKEKLSKIIHFDICEGALTHIEVDVPSNKFGAIIGPRGSTIKHIQETTRAAVHVPSANEKGGVIVSGTPAACDKAVKAISDKIGSSPSTTKTSETLAIKQAVNAYDLGKKVSRVLFFPDHDEDDHQRTFDVFIRYLGSATKTLDVCIFALTNDRIAETVLNAHRRGVVVRVICDDDQAKSKGADIHKLQTAGIAVRMDMSQFHMHNKFAILDSKVLMNGSFNWTVQAVTSNNENVMISSDAQMVSQYVTYFEKTWKEFGQLAGN